MGLVAMRVRLVGVVLALTVFHDVTSEISPTCTKLHNTFSFAAPVKRYMSINGKLKNITLYWGSDPAHAASALLTVILRHAHGYEHVRMMHGEDDLTSFAKTIPYNIYGQYNDTILALSMAWDPTTEPYKANEIGSSTGLGAPRLQNLGVSRVPASLRLHAHLPATFREKQQCKQFTHWHFYLNYTALENCGFIDKSDKNATVYIILDSSNKTIKAEETLKTRAKVFSLFLQFKNLDRQTHFQILNAANESFLFIDYNMWVNESNVNTVQEPPCLSNDLTCQPGLDNAIGLRVAEVSHFAEYASQLYQLAHKFIPPPDSLRFILKHIKNSTDIEEAACKWVSENLNRVYLNWVKQYEPKQKNYEIAVFYSHGPEKIQYLRLMNMIFEELREQFKSSFKLQLRLYTSNYFEAKLVKLSITHYMTYTVRQRLIGAVVGGNDKTTEIVKTLDGMGLPVLLYDVAAVDADSTTSVWLTTGRLAHLTLAVKKFIHSNHWKRVAVLSDSTHTAQLFHEALSHESDFAIRNYPVQQKMSNTSAEIILKQLKTENAYIIVVNTYYQDIATILTAAAALNMNGSEYAWIVREWKQYDKYLNVTFFTFSFWCPSGNDVSTRHNGSENLLQRIDDIWPQQKWPRSVAALIDSLWTMAKGFQDVLHKYPRAREDPHSKEAIRQFGRSVIDLSPIKGFTQNLIFKGHSIENTVIYLDKWHDGNRKLLARWSVNATSGEVDLVHKYQDVYPNDATKPYDGTFICLMATGDPYLPECYDTFLIIALLLLVVAPLVVTLIYHAFSRHLKELKKKIISALLAQRMERAATLSSYVVDRSALKPREELGAGRFGCVRLADLHVPGCKARVVAAKELRDHQDESEILREACILASLKHDNIIRLVGVCIDNEPTLVLMEVAFFGDLLQYLKDRRHIAESAAYDVKAEAEQVSEEAAHVSANSLTRLAREAASALAYLALCGVIHRDLRASNCLVDERRSLKLADFGLARETKANGLDGGGEYACRRRGLFPVLWMAPESLIFGVFSTASDVYSLGMLMFELVTLGARPYGNVSPLRVMQYVTSGGMPRMPADATPQATGLAQLCWQRQPEKRPTAADLVAYLAEHPNALSPVLDYENNRPTDADSGYGESPSTEMLIPA